MRKKKISFLGMLMIFSLLVCSYVMAGVGVNNALPVDGVTKSYVAISAISDFSKYSTDYGYESLASLPSGKDMQSLYNAILAEAEKFWNNAADVTQTKDGNGVIAIIDLSSYNLSIDEIAATYVTFQNDNPIFYFALNNISVEGSSLYFLTDAAYNKASVRNDCKADIIKGLNEFGKLVDGKTSECDIIMSIQDKISEKIYYDEEWLPDGGYFKPSDEVYAHNIMGYFDDDIAKGVCECYARVFQLAMNAAGIENYFVSGFASGSNDEQHAWNMAKFDDGKYYYLDATWDDANGNYDYFAKGTSFTDDHIKREPTGAGIYYLYKLPDVPSTNYKVTPPSTISSVSDFKKIALNPSGTYTLAANIDFSKEVCGGDGSAYLDIKFSGTLNGKSYKISGLKTGLFTEITKSGNVNNLKLEADFTGSAWNGNQEIAPQNKYALAGKNYGTVTSTEIEYKINDGKGRELQTIWTCGMFEKNYGTVNKCNAVVNVVNFEKGYAEFLRVCGITLENYGNITNCVVTLNVKNNSNDTSICIQGIAEYNYQDGVIDNCTSNGTVITAGDGSLAFAGIVCNNGNTGVVKNCTNNADARCSTGLELYAGGIVIVNNGTIENCTNTGDLYNEYCTDMIGMTAGIGGICGWNADNAVVKGCTNEGAVSGELTAVGGIVGDSRAGSKVENCINLGTITADSATGESVYAGGIVGEISLNVINEATGMITGNVYVTKCVNKGQVINKQEFAGYAACIVCSIWISDEKSSVIITDCENYGIAKLETKTYKNVYGYYYYEPTGTIDQNENLVITNCNMNKTSSIEETTTKKNESTTTNKEDVTTKKNESTTTNKEDVTTKKDESTTTKKEDVTTKKDESSTTTKDDEGETTSEEETTTVDTTEDYVVNVSKEEASLNQTQFENILNENKEKDIVIKTDNGVEFTFPKGSMSSVEDKETYDFGVTVTTDFDDKADNPEKVTKDNFVTKVSYNYSGELPGKAVIKIFVGTEMKGNTLFYYLVNEDNTVTYIQSSKVDESGYMSVEQDHCSDYIVTAERIDDEIETEPSSDEELTEDTTTTAGETEDKVTSDNQTDKDSEDEDGNSILPIVIVVIVILAVAGGIGGYIIVSKKKK